jgi:hypothetical protein
MSTDPKDGTLELPPETWGDLMKRAYRHGKRRYAYTYLEISERMTEAGIPISDQTLLRFEEAENPPSSPRQLTNAVFYAMALGYAPKTLGLPDATEAMRAYNVAYLKKVLDPKSRMVKTVGKQVRSRWSGPKPTSGDLHTSGTRPVLTKS